MARILVAGSLGWDVPLWLDRPLTSGARIGALSLAADPAGGALPGRLGGGAANIAAALALAGHSVLVAGRVGADAAGELVMQALRARGLALDAVAIDAFPTASAQILIEPNGERTILGIGWTRAAWAALAPWTLDAELVASFAPDAVVLRASRPVVPFDARLNAPGLVVAHMPWLGPVPARVDVAVGSVDDLGPDVFADALGAARSIFAQAKWGVMTAGARGARAQGDNAAYDVPAVAADVVDVTGAGDIFMAGLTDALVRGAGMEAALAHGCLWGSAAVSMEGSAPAPGTPGFPGFSR